MHIQPQRMVLVFLVILGVIPFQLLSQSDAIQPSETHQQYWQYKNSNVLLLGGSVEDNLFQIDDLAIQLDLLKAAGGNYVRNTMSSRDPGNAWPFKKMDGGKFDLNEWDENYWQRFSEFLQETAARDIIVQIEVWATFDFYRDNWQKNPFNPVNNVNYNLQRSKLSEDVPSHPIFTDNNFFRSVPSKMNIAPVLWYQKLFVEKLLSYSLQYDHVLYCMDNETSVTSDWGKFWARHIQKKARLIGKTAHTTEMWDPHNLAHPMHFETFDNPDIFTFVDISQNNHQSGDNHWNNGLKQIEYLENMAILRPVNNVKIYGNDGGRHKTTRDAIEAFCRNILMGCASARFHRPTSGQGLNETAQSVIKSMRALTDAMDFFDGKPANKLLADREPNEAFCRAIAGQEYAVYFTNGGTVTLDMKNHKGSVLIRWLDIMNSEWSVEKPTTVHEKLQLQAPGTGHWAALVK